MIDRLKQHVFKQKAERHFIVQVVAGLLASTSDGRLLTNSLWKCTTQPTATNWMSPTYNDSMWPAAVVAAPHSSSDIHRVIAGISTNASWIWTVNNGYGRGIDTSVYCRFTLHC